MLNCFRDIQSNYETQEQADSSVFGENSEELLPANRC